MVDPGIHDGDFIFMYGVIPEWPQRSMKNRFFLANSDGKERYRSEAARTPGSPSGFMVSPPKLQKNISLFFLLLYNLNGQMAMMKGEDI